MQETSSGMAGKQCLVLSVGVREGFTMGQEGWQRPSPPPVPHPSQHSMAWLPAPTPATRTPSVSCALPKAAKPLLMPTSHPKAPYVHPSAHITHCCNLLHPSFLLLPELPAYEQPAHQTNEVAAHHPRPRCLGKPRQAGYGCLACPGQEQAVCKSGCQGFCWCNSDGIDTAPP